MEPRNLLAFQIVGGNSYALDSLEAYGKGAVILWVNAQELSCKALPAHVADNGSVDSGCFHSARFSFHVSETKKYFVFETAAQQWSL